MEAIMSIAESTLIVVEGAAQAHGAKLRQAAGSGTGCFSFTRRKT
jgi:dTDP-4-amino-4,6-dideoxygalactose transaminase